MEVAYQFLAQVADTADTGLVHAMGIGMDTVESPSFPAIMMPFAIVTALKVEANEVGADHNFRLQLLKPDEEWISISEPRPFKTIPHPTRPEQYTYANIVARLNLAFSKPGDYALRLLVDDDPMQPISLRVIERPEKSDSARG